MSTKNNGAVDLHVGVETPLRRLADQESWITLSTRSSEVLERLCSFKAIMLEPFIAPRLTTGIRRFASGGLAGSVALLIVLCAFTASEAGAQSLAVGSASGAAGSQVQIKVSFTAGATGVIQLQFDLGLPSPMTYVSTAAGDAATAAGKFVAGNAIGSTVRVVIFSVSQTAIGTGEVAVVTYGIPAGTAPGDYVVSISQIVATDAMGLSVPVTGSGGTISVPCDLPAAPTGFSPPDGATGIGLSPTLSWGVASGATSYEVRFGTSSPPPVVGTTSATSYNPGPLQSNTLYYWQVSAKNDCGATPGPAGSFTAQVLPSIPPSLSINGTTFNPGELASVTILNGPGNPTDWVGLYITGAGHTRYLDRRYLNGQNVPPTAGSTNATLSFTMPSPSGAYDFRFFARDGYMLLAKSATVTVLPVATPLAVTTSTQLPTGKVGTNYLAMIVATGGIPRYSWSVISGSLPQGLSLNSQNGAIGGIPEVAGASGFTIQVSDRGSPVQQAQRSFNLEVEAGPSLQVGKTTANPGEIMGVAVLNGPGNPTDWVGFYRAGAGHSRYIEKKYLDGTKVPPSSGRTNATLSFTMPTTPGSYNFRFFAKDGYTVLATSPTVTVAAP